MNTWALIGAGLLLAMAVGSSSAETYVYTGTAYTTECGHGAPCGNVHYAENTGLPPGSYDVDVSVSGSFDNDGCPTCNSSCATGEAGSAVFVAVYQGSSLRAHATVCSNTGGGSASYVTENLLLSGVIYAKVFIENGYGEWCCPSSAYGTIIISDAPTYTASGVTDCVDLIELYVYESGSYHYTNSTSGPSYSFRIYDGLSYRLLFDGTYYDFVCDGDEVFDYDACYFVYGYTCGVDTIKLRDNNFQLIDTVYQNSSYDIYEMQIVDGEEYTISFYDFGILLCYNQTFTCTGNHVIIDFDRCNYLYPPKPPAPPYTIYLWAGYDYNIVVFKDTHGNFIENSQMSIYDKTDNQYLQRWTNTKDGYTLLGARFDTDHEVILSLRTFDGIFTLDTTYPANGSAEIGEEDITTTNWTIPINYNLDILPVDIYGVSVFNVFCGLSEYTPLNPGSFWGMDLSDRGYVSVTNCSGFSMCDIIAEKDGYADYKVEALNWTSKSAMVKDYRYNIIMEEE